jgi:hypothetical protein
MTQQLLDPPRPVRAEPPRPVGPRVARPRPRDSQWLLPAGIAISAALHIILFLVLRFSVPSWTSAFAEAEAVRASAPAPGMRVVQVVPTEGSSSDPIRAADPEPDLQPSRSLTPVPITPPRSTVPRSGTPLGDPRSLAERTRPRFDDPRLWDLPAPPVPLPAEFDVALAPLYARLGVIADSMYAAGVAAERALDWTVTDDDGN